MSPIFPSPSSPSSSSSVPVVTGGYGGPPLHPRQAFGLAFWPILFGAFLILLFWGLWKWKAGFWTSGGPLSTPAPPSSAVTQMAHVRGAPIFGHPLGPVGSKSSVLSPPPPVYVNPPRYDDVQRSCDEGIHPS